MRACVLFILISTVAGAQASERDHRLLAWLLSPAGELPAGDLVAGLGDPSSVEASVARVMRIEDRLPPGYHVLQVPGFDPPLLAAVLVPRAAGGPLPVLVAPTPSIILPPDELPCRARFHAWLEEGWAVLVPVPQRWSATPGYDPRRDTLREGRVLLPSYVAALSRRLPVDRDRVVLADALTDIRNTVETPALLFAGDPTPFAAYHLVLPGARFPEPFRDPGRWDGRLIVMHLSSHPPDATLLVRNRLQERERQGRLRLLVLRDPALDWAGRRRFTRRAVHEISARVGRGPWPVRIECMAGGRDAPAGHEWIQTHGLTAPVRLVVEREGDAIRIATPEEPERAPFPCDLYLRSIPQSLRVTFNGRPLFGGPVPHGPREALLAARHRVRTGRRETRGVLSIRP